MSSFRDRFQGHIKIHHLHIDESIHGSNWLWSFWLQITHRSWNVKRHNLMIKYPFPLDHFHDFVHIKKQTPVAFHIAEEFILCDIYSFLHYTFLQYNILHSNRYSTSVCMILAHHNISSNRGKQWLLSLDITISGTLTFACVFTTFLISMWSKRVSVSHGHARPNITEDNEIWYEVVFIRTDKIHNVSFSWKKM